MDQSAAIRQLLCPKERWTNDKNVTNCQSCKKLFVPLFVWKHHCRFCGRVFCNNCTSNVMTGQSINYEGQKKLRHCKSCRQRIQMVLQTENKDYNKQTDIFETQSTILSIEIDQPDAISVSNQERQIQQGLLFLISQHKLTLQQQALALLKKLSLTLCQKYGLQVETWHVRLAEIAWQSALETKPTIFIRKEGWNLQQEIKIVTIIAPTEAVAGVCVKGIILERNIPSKQLQTHMKFARVITIKTALEADSLVRANKSGTIRFDEMVRNENLILSSYLDKVFKLEPKVIFVQEQVSKAAMELALQKGIMIISKVNNLDLSKIERLTLIRKRIENILTLDRYNPAEFVGFCPKIYFKNVRSGEMLLFLQHQAGIRTVVLGDTSQQSNIVLKKVFLILLQAAWNLKLQRQLALRDLKSSQTNKESSPYLIRPFLQQKYENEDQFNATQQIFTFKVIYSVIKIQSLSKSFQQYSKLRNKSRLLDICGPAKWSMNKFYCGEHFSLGTFIMKSAVQLDEGCVHCSCRHFIRYFIGEYSINISFEYDKQSKPIKLTHLQEDDDFEDQQLLKQNQKQKQCQNSKLHEIFTQFFQAYKQQLGQSHLKLKFFMYFRCLDCGKTMKNSSVKVGNDFLLLDFAHFLSLLTSAPSQNTLHFDTANSCSHKQLVRIIQGPRIAVSFEVRKQMRYEISLVVLGEAEKKGLVVKDQKMVSELFKKLLIQKLSCIQNLESQLSKLPFSASLSYGSLSFSTSNIYQTYIEPYYKMQQTIQAIKIYLTQIQQNINTIIQNSLIDWTQFLRKCAKIDHVFKITYECINFISNSLKKQRLQQNTNILEQQDFPTYFQQKIGINRTNSELKTELDLQVQSKTQSLASAANMGANTPTNRMRKQTSFYLESDFDKYYKRINKHRYLMFKGAILYYPVATIDDPVSLLTCCLNSDQLQDQLGQKNYKDQIKIKISFTRQLESEWSFCSEINKVYKELTKEDCKKGQIQDIHFSIYYHNEFQALRVSQGIDFTLYVRSLYGCQNWDSSGGKSNSTFYKGYNQTLVVKIINEKQFVQFQKFAQAYLKYMRYKRQTNQQSFLAKIYGIYEVLIKNKVYKCVVMQNLFFGIDKVTQVYDLKGSEVNRLAQAPPDKTYTGLDTNFIIDKDGKPYLLQPDVYDKLIIALTQDANFLKEAGVIDYSLLVIESQQGLRMAIIDFMRPYHLVEKLQNLYKQIKSGKDPTVIPPNQYADRFVRAMKRYFAKTNNI